MSIIHERAPVAVGPLEQGLRAVRLPWCSSKLHRRWRPHLPKPRRAVRGPSTLAIPVLVEVVEVVEVVEALELAAGLAIAKGQHVRLITIAPIHILVSVEFALEIKNALCALYYILPISIKKYLVE